MGKVFLFGILFSCRLMAGDYFDKETELTFPENLAGYALVWEAGRAKPTETFEDPRLGYSIAYTSPTSQMTIYAFTGGADDIQDGVTCKRVRQFFEQAVSEIKLFEERGYYRQVRVLPPGEEFSNLCPKFFLGKKLTYTVAVEVPEEKVKSYVFCCGVKGRIFKVRVTGNHDAKFEESLVRFLTGFADQLETRRKTAPIDPGPAATHPEGGSPPKRDAEGSSRLPKPQR